MTDYDKLGKGVQQLGCSIMWLGCGGFILLIAIALIIWH
jgi:hypothetical protein